MRVTLGVMLETPPGGRFRGPPRGGPPGIEAGGDQKPPFDLDIFAGIDQPLAPFINKHPDPQGEFDDWIELANASTQTIDLSHMYLTDEEGELRKWKFPEGTQIEPRGFLIVWADGDVDATGLHAGFKLSKSGEMVRLIDSDRNRNQILDEVTFGEQDDDRSLGRTSSGKFESQRPSPGTGNVR